MITPVETKDLNTKHIIAAKLIISALEHSLLTRDNKTYDEIISTPFRNLKDFGLTQEDLNEVKYLNLSDLLIK